MNHKKWKLMIMCIASMLVALGCSQSVPSTTDSRTLEIVNMVQPTESVFVWVKGDAAQYVQFLESKNKVMAVDDTVCICCGNLATIRAKDNSSVDYTIMGDRIHRITKDSNGNVAESVWLESNESDFRKLEAIFRRLPKSKPDPSGFKGLPLQEQGDDRWGMARYSVFDVRKAITIAKQGYPDFSSTPNTTITRILPMGGMWGSTRDVKFTTSVEQIDEKTFSVTFCKDWNLNVCGTDAISYWRYTVTSQGAVLTESVDNESVMGIIK